MHCIGKMLIYVLHKLSSFKEKLLSLIAKKKYPVELARVIPGREINSFLLENPLWNPSLHAPAQIKKLKTILKYFKKFWIFLWTYIQVSCMHVNIRDKMIFMLVHAKITKSVVKIRFKNSFWPLICLFRTEQRIY